MLGWAKHGREFVAFHLAQSFRFASPSLIRAVSVGAPVNDDEVRQRELLDIDDLLRPSKNPGMSASLSEAELKCELFKTPRHIRSG
jgi:hypothetical protein